jgi:hypothetical protein
MLLTAAARRLVTERPPAVRLHSVKAGEHQRLACVSAAAAGHSPGGLRLMLRGDSYTSAGRRDAEGHVGSRVARGIECTEVPNAHVQARRAHPAAGSDVLTCCGKRAGAQEDFMGRVGTLCG